MENLFSFVGFCSSSLVVWFASSMAYKRPRIVRSKAESFVVVDIVMIVVFVVVIVVVINRPVKMLPKARRVIGLVRALLSSVIRIVGFTRGVVVCT